MACKELASGLAVYNAKSDCLTPIPPGQPGQILIQGPDGPVWIDPAISPLIDNGDGTFTYTDENGVQVTFDGTDDQTAAEVPYTPAGPLTATDVQGALDEIAPYLHPAAVVTNNTAPFAWDAATQTGNIPAQDLFVDNGDGTGIITPGDGSAPVPFATADDQTAAEVPYVPVGPLTATDVQGALDEIAPYLHPAAVVTNNTAPFSWDAATQTLNIPAQDLFVDNGDGTGIITPGDGSAPVPFATADDQTAAEVPYVPVGPLTATDVQGALDEIAPYLHPAAVVTNDAAPFAWDAATQTLNIPQAGQMAVDPAAGTITFTPGDGSAPVVADICSLLDACSIDALGDVNAPAPTNGQVLSFNGTEWVPVDPVVENFLSAASYDPATNILTLTLVDGSSFPVDLTDLVDAPTAAQVPYTPAAPLTATDVQGAIDEIAPLLHPAATLTTSVAPFAWDAATQTGNIPAQDTLVDNGNGTLTFTPGDGSAPTTFNRGWTTVAQDPATKLITFTYPDGTTTVIDPCDCPSINADFTPLSKLAAPGDVVQFTDTSTGNGTCVPDSWLWDFGDGQTSTLQNPTHTYADAGFYAVTLTTNCAADGLTDTQLGIVKVDVASTTIKAAFTVDQVAGVEPLTINVTDASTSSNCTIVDWLYELSSDGGATWNIWGIDQNPSGALVAGNYLLRLTVTCDDGTQDTSAPTPIVVTNVASIDALFIQDKNSGAPGLVVNFTDQSTGANGCTVDGWLWEYSSDGGTTWTQFSTVQNPSFTFANVGTYQTRLTATCSDGGLTDTYVLPTDTVVTAAPVIDALFVQDVNSGAPGLVVNFTDQSTGANGCTVDGWLWEYSSDGGTTWTQFSTVQNPSFTFANVGTYKTRLTATCSDGGLTDTYVLPTDTVVTAAPVIDALFIQDKNSGAPGLVVNFTDQSTGANGCTVDGWLWEYSSDGGTTWTAFSTVQNPSFTFANVGTYKTRLTATCSDGSLTDTYVLPTDTVVTAAGCAGTETCYLARNTALPTILWSQQQTWDAANPAWDTAFANSIRTGGTQTVNNMSNLGVDMTVTGGGGGFPSGQPAVVLLADPYDPALPGDSIRYRLNANATGFVEINFSEPVCFYVDLSLKQECTAIISTTDPITLWAEGRDEFTSFTNNGTNSIEVKNNDTVTQHQIDFLLSGNVTNLRIEATNAAAAAQIVCTWRLQAAPASSPLCQQIEYIVCDDGNGNLTITNPNDPADIQTAVNPEWVLVDCASI